MHLPISNNKGCSQVLAKGLSRNNQSGLLNCPDPITARKVRNYSQLLPQSLPPVSRCGSMIVDAITPQNGGGRGNRNCFPFLPVFISAANLLSMEADAAELAQMFFVSEARLPSD